MKDYSNDNNDTQFEQAYLDAQSSTKILIDCQSQVYRILVNSKERMDFLLSSFVTNNHRLIPNNEHMQSYYEEIKNNYQKIITLLEEFNTEEEE